MRNRHGNLFKCVLVVGQDQKDKEKMKKKPVETERVKQSKFAVKAMMEEPIIYTPKKKAKTKRMIEFEKYERMHDGL